MWTRRRPLRGFELQQRASDDSAAQLLARAPVSWLNSSSSRANFSSAGRPVIKECSASSRDAGRPSAQHEIRTMGSWILNSKPLGTRICENFRTTHDGDARVALDQGAGA